MSTIDNEVNIRLLTLSGCDYCLWLKEGLNKEKIEYVDIDAEMFSDFADEVEKAYQTNHYPIVFIEYKDKVITILGETRLETSNTLRTFDSIPELLDMIKQYKNEI